MKNEITAIKCIFYPDILQGRRDDKLEPILPPKVESVIKTFTDNLHNEDDKGKELMLEHIEFLKPHIGKRIDYEVVYFLLSHQSSSRSFRLSIPLSSIIFIATRLLSPASNGNDTVPR